MRILVVEDDRPLAGFLRRGLAEQGYAVDVAGDGDDGLHLARSGLYDLVLLDIMLPGRSGFEVVRTLRREGVATPVLCLTARDSPEDKVTGLDLGADDYLAKPFQLSELLARVRALLRRSPQMAPALLTCGDLELDPLKRTVRRAGRDIDLTPREFALLEFLLRRAGAVVTRTAIFEGVWDMNFETLTNVLEVHVSRLRAKLDREGGRPLLHTVRSVGYVMRCEEDR